MTFSSTEMFSRLRFVRQSTYPSLRYATGTFLQTQSSVGTMQSTHEMNSSKDHKMARCYQRSRRRNIARNANNPVPITVDVMAQPPRVRRTEDHQDRNKPLEHDWAVHDPIGGASHYFGSNGSFMSYIASSSQYTNVAQRPIRIHIGAQPNCRPHIGNLVTFTTAFVLASSIQKLFPSRKVEVVFTFVDSAPAVGGAREIGGIKYQVSLGRTGAADKMGQSFETFLQSISTLTKIPVQIYDQSFWRSNPHFPSVMKKIASNYGKLSPLLRDKLVIRAPCPVAGCGLTDKHGINNNYTTPGTIQFTCPSHGAHHVDLSATSDLQRLEFNTPMRNLVRVILMGMDETADWIQCTAGDYAGFYMDQLLHRPLRVLTEHEGPVPYILYAPLVQDWSGAKLSKSLYVKHGAYDYLIQMARGYMLDSDLFMAMDHGLEGLVSLVGDWVREPFRLFRPYSVDYIHCELQKRGMRNRPSISEGFGKGSNLVK